ncbi:hypothetical protein C5T93_27920 [Raoultella ornithinolytica]|nr:hypothetical protein C5T93_27920 [Raoultella ornithinolytica]
MGSCAAPSAKGDDKFITTDYLQQCPQSSPEGTICNGRICCVRNGVVESRSQNSESCNDYRINYQGYLFCFHLTSFVNVIYQRWSRPGSQSF